jgi:hypothetical protein
MSEEFTWQDTDLDPTPPPEGPSPDNAPQGASLDLRQYRTFQSERQTPEWLQGKGGKAWFQASGDRLDELAHRANQAILARFPYTAPPDALGLVGQDRLISRNETDTDAEFAARLQSAWTLQHGRGTVEGVLRLLLYHGHETVAYSILRKYWLDSGGDLQQTPYEYNFDYPNTWWSKILFFFPTIPAEDERINIGRLVKTWKSSLSRVFLCFVGDSLLWDYPEGTWDEEETYTWDELGSDTPILLEVR